MDPATPTRIDQFNAAVRGLVTLILIAGFVYGFIVNSKVSGEVFSTVVAGVIGYWFASRDTKAAMAAGGPTTTTRTPDTTVITGPTPPPATG